MLCKRAHQSKIIGTFSVLSLIVGLLVVIGSMIELPVLLVAQTNEAVAPATISKRVEEDGIVRWESKSVTPSHRPRFFDVFSAITSISLPDDPEQLPFGRSVAFLVGVSRYANLDPLPGAEESTKQLRDYLLRDGGFDVVYELTDFGETPNRFVRPSTVRNYMLNRFSKELRRNDRLLFYFVGHGTDRNATTGYLLFRNASKEKYNDEYLPTNDIREWSQVVPARHILFMLDACSAGFGFGLAPQGAADLGVLTALGETRSREIITAGTGKQETFDVDGPNNSHLTAFGAALLSALKHSTASEDFRSLITTDRLFTDLSAKELAFANTYAVSLKPGRYPILTEGQFVFPNGLAKGSQAPPYLTDALKSSGNSPHPSPQTRASAAIENELGVSIPKLVTGGAPIGSRFQYNFAKGSVVCTGEYIKVSPTEWYERPAARNASGCLVDSFIFQYTERVSDDPRYILLYDESRNLLARIVNANNGELTPTDWRLVTEHTWNAGHSVTRIN
jgi:hypothetical protein